MVVGEKPNEKSQLTIKSMIPSNLMEALFIFKSRMLHRAAIGILLLCAACVHAETPATAPPTTAPAATTAPAVLKVVEPADVASVYHPTGERHERGMLERFRKQIANDKKIELLFIGDSITWGWIKAPEVWNQYYGKWDAANFGDGGAYTQHVLWCVENENLEEIDPKVTVLLIGINNIYHGTNYTPEQVAGGIKKIVDTIHQKMPKTKVLLLGLFPYYRGKDSARPRNDAAAVNAIIKKFDDGSKTRYLELWNKFLQPDGNGVSIDVMSDGLHPTPKGYQIWAEAMQPLLTEMMK